MQFEEFMKLVRGRRSVRKFRPDPVPDEYIEQVLEAARWAMSGANGQPWEFIVIKDQATKDKMAEQYIKVRQREYIVETARLEELRQNIYASPPTGAPSFQQAPVIIAMVADKRTFQATVLSGRYHPAGEGGVDGTFYKGMGNVTMLLHLAVAARGLSSQWFSVAGLWDPELKQLLNVPMDLCIHTIVPIGYPAYEPPPPYRRELGEIVHYERYDLSKYRSDEDMYNFIVELRRRTRAAYGLKPHPA